MVVHSILTQSDSRNNILKLGNCLEEQSVCRKFVITRNLATNTKSDQCCNQPTNLTVTQKPYYDNWQVRKHIQSDKHVILPVLQIVNHL